MTTWVIIPVKPLRLAKSRLAQVLTPVQRQLFAEHMLRHVLEVVQTVPQITGTLVISRDNHVLSIARDYGAKTIQESGAPELNVALMRATSVINSWRSDGVLILPADLPFIAPEDIRNMLNMAGEERCVVLSTDRNKDGTNALLIRPPGLIEYAYGEGSFQLHAVAARDAGAQVHVYESERLVQDIDLPEDVENYSRMIERGDYPDLLTLDDIRTQREV